MTAGGLIVFLAILWVAVTGGPSIANLVLGAVVGALVLRVLNIRMTRPALWGRAWQVVRLFGLFLRELTVSALQVARLVLTPDLRGRLKPAIIAFPLSVETDVEITLLANLITLTPGTMSVDVSADRHLLYIHALSIDDREAFVRSIADGFEKQVMAVFR